MVKLLVLLALSGLVAIVSSDCGPMQRLKVKKQWAQIYTGITRTELVTSVFKALFAQAPESHKLFERVHCDDINSPMCISHMRRVLGGLDMCISLLDEPAILQAELDHLAEQHKMRGIPKNYFELMGSALLEVLPAQLERCFDYKAWSSCYKVVMDGITKT